MKMITTEKRTVLLYVLVIVYLLLYFFVGRGRLFGSEQSIYQKNKLSNPIQNLAQAPEVSIRF